MCSCHDELPQKNIMGSTYHEAKFLKHSFSLHNLIISDICYSSRILTNTAVYVLHHYLVLGTVLYVFYKTEVDNIV
jgi:hypothetical protein